MKRLATKNTKTHKDTGRGFFLVNFCGRRLRFLALWRTRHGAPCYVERCSAPFAVFSSSRHSLRAGMTLIELIITLSIMAAVASIALVTLSDMGTASRYDETERRGLAAQQAVIGRPGETSRFFNDLGRYPLVLTTNENQSLAELYDTGLTAVSHYKRLPLPVPSFGSDFSGGSVPSELLTVTNSMMGAGWRGPYLLNRNDSFKTFTDNWGQPWLVSPTNEPVDFSGLSESVLMSTYSWTSSAALYSELRTILSLGHGEDYLGKNQVYPFYESSVFGSLDVTLKVFRSNTWSGVSTDDYDRFRVSLYVPRSEPGAAPELCEVSAWNAGGSNDVDKITDSGDTDYVYTDALMVFNDLSCVTFTDIPVGVRKIWAYAVGTSATNWIRPQTIEIKPGAQAITLYLNEDL